MDYSTNSTNKQQPESVGQKGGVSMKMSALVKTIVFILLLIGTHVLLGNILNRVQSHYDELIPPSLNLVLWVVGSVLLCEQIGGLVTVLVRPLWIAVLSFFLAVTVMFLVWGPNLYSAIASLVYFGIATLFCITVINEMKNRLFFSVNPFQQGQMTLLFGLVLMIGAGFAFGFREAEYQSGELIPSAFQQKITDSILNRMQTQVENQSDLNKAENAIALLEMQKGIGKFWTQADTLLEPYAPYLPFVIGALLVWVLTNLLCLLSWFPPRLLNGIVKFLKGIGVTHEVIETTEVRRLVLD